MNEQFSAFLDGEATRNEADSVVNALLSDERLRQSWTRQYWIKTALRSREIDPDVALDSGFADRVMKAVANDDPQQAAGAITASMPRDHDKVTELPRRIHSRRWKKGVASMAAAASVAGIVLFTGSPFMRNSGSETEEQMYAAAGDSQHVTWPQDQTDDSSRQPNLADVSTVSASRTRSVASVGSSSAQIQPMSSQQVSYGPADHWSVNDPDVRSELNGYLAYHDGMSRGYGMPGKSPSMIHAAAYGQGAIQ